MLWLCRTGKDAKYFDICMERHVITIPWDGFNLDLSHYKTFEQFRRTVEDEKKDETRTSLANWTVQMYSFCQVMEIGDYVLVPTKKSKSYVLGKISSDYFYDAQLEIHHFRGIAIICDGIPRDIFPRYIQYSLGAYRTIFKPSYEDKIMELINQWKDNKYNANG